MEYLEISGNHNFVSLEINDSHAKRRMQFLYDDWMCVLSVRAVFSLFFRSTSQHQFWVPHEVEEEVENKELSAEMKSRYITFAGKFKPVEHKCKAPMPDGSLCERQDRVKVRRATAVLS